MSRPKRNIRQSNVRVIPPEPPVVVKSNNPMIESTLDPDWLAQYKRANVRSALARCYIALAEVDYDLRAWRNGLAVSESMARFDSVQPWHGPEPRP